MKNNNYEIKFLDRTEDMLIYYRYAPADILNEVERVAVRLKKNSNDKNDKVDELKNIFE